MQFLIVTINNTKIKVSTTLIHAGSNPDGDNNILTS